LVFFIHCLNFLSSWFLMLLRLFQSLVLGLPGRLLLSPPSSPLEPAPSGPRTLRPVDARLERVWRGRGMMRVEAERWRLRLIEELRQRRQRRELILVPTPSTPPLPVILRAARPWSSSSTVTRHRLLDDLS
jgi:hypothetical protein